MSAPLATGYEHLPHDSARVVDEACDQFELAWQSGQQPAIEQYLESVAEPVQQVLMRELVLLDVALRSGGGESPPAGEYHRRFPTLDEQWLANVLLEPTQPRVGYVAETTPDGVPGFEILGELGRGGMGVVYKARDTRLGRMVALKFLANEAANDPRRLERFRREARAASALNHPAVCTLHELAEHRGQPFLVLEWVEGQTLRALVKQRADLTTVVQAARQIAEALSVAHAAGIVHRDLKPENLMIRPDGYVKVLDFGLARLLQDHVSSSSASAAADTDTGQLMGTANYMSPEQARAESLGAATDIFSFGVVLYELITGRHPFSAASDFGPHTRANDAAPIALRRLNAEASELLDSVIAQMLNDDPRRRPTAADVEARLGKVLRGTTGTAASRLNALPRSTVGREKERSMLRDAFFAATTGTGSIICVSGEPGIGKTTLIEEFLEELAGSGRAFITARGRCSERLAGSEAYLPLLEAIGSMNRGVAGEVAARALRVLAPSWHLQLFPNSVDGTLSIAGQTLSQERLKRELLAMLEEVSRTRPIVLFLDDIHWSDAATVDILAYIGARCADLSILIVFTYRPAELAVAQHAFGPVKLELQGRGLCREVALPLLDRSEISRFLALTFPGHDFPEAFAAAIQVKTGGNPLFMADLLRYLKDGKFAVQNDGRWTLTQTLPDFQRDLPETIRGMIQRKTNQLDEVDRQLLSAASVQGLEFDSAVVAQVLDKSPAEVEERLVELERVHGLVRMVREREFPERTLSLRYSFVHALYQNALFAALQPSRRAAWSKATAQSLLQLLVENTSPVATELALLLEAARDFEQSSQFFLVAAQNAVRLSAHREAIALANRGLASLEKLPESIARRRRELATLIARGVSLVATQGFADHEVEQTYQAARSIGQSLDDVSALFPVLYGLWNVYLLRCNWPRCNELSEQMSRLAESQDDAVYLLQAHNVVQQPLFHIGELSSARRHQESSLDLYDADRHGTLTATFGEDPGVGCLVYRAATLWHLGYAHQALLAVQSARQLADKLGYPFNRARALYFSTLVHMFRREPALVHEFADQLVELCHEQGFAMLFAGGQIARGWSMANRNQSFEGIQQMQEGLAGWQATGALSHFPYQLALLAEALVRSGQCEQALTALDQAIALAAANSERFYEAELHRLRGELLTVQDAVSKSEDGSAISCLETAYSIAAKQSAKALELRAATGIARLRARQDRSDEGRMLLQNTFDWFTEGFDTADLQDAKILLQQLR